MRSRLRSLLFIISLSVLLMILVSFDRRPRISDFVTSPEEMASDMSALDLKVVAPPQIYFDEERLFFDEQSQTFYYSVTEGSKSGLDPHVSLSSALPDAKLMFSSRITAELIAGNTPILLSVYNDTDYEIFFLKVTTLPMINIDCSETITASVNSEIYLTVFDNGKNSEKRLTESKGVIHSRGATSALYPKANYRISLKQDSPGGSSRNNRVSLLGMRQDDDWLLYAAYSDPEKIRNVFSQNLWYVSCNTDNSYRKETGTQYRFVELFLNRQYCGLYAICPPIDEKMLGLNGDLTEQVLYKYVYFVGDHPEKTENNTAAGVLIKHPSPDDPPDSDGNYGKKEYRLFFRYFDYLNDHRDDNSLLAGGIDMDNAIDIHLFVNLIQGVDQTRAEDSTIKNLHLALFRENGRIKGLYCPWDMDLAWGNLWAGDIVHNMVGSYYLSPEDDFNIDCGYLAQMIKNDRQSLTKALSDKYAELRAHAWSDENILAMLNEYEAQIFDSGAYLREMSRWPDATFEDPNLKLSVFKEYVLRRLEVCDKTYGFNGGKQDE